MTCVSPPELADRDLLTYIDGEADDRVIAHLEQCPHCRARAQRLARLQDWLTARLYRFNCPSPIELGEYQLGILPGERAAAMARHLAECPRCAQEVAQLQGYLADLAPTLELSPLERVREQARILVARLVSGGFEGRQSGYPALAPAYAGLRGREGEPLIYEANQVQVVLDIQEDPRQPGRQTILGLIVGVDHPRELEALLWQDDQCIATISVDEASNFFIPNLTPGRYELILSGPGVEIHIQGLDVGTHTELSGSQET
jgi:anti-sigma factor RsiW